MRRRDPQSRGRIAIDDHVFFQPADLLIAVHVFELRNGPQLLQKLGRPCVELVQVFARQGVLELGVGHASADLQILHALEVQGCAGNMRQLGTQAADYLVHADLALGQRLERHKHARLVLGRAAAHGGDNILHCGVLLHDADELVGLAQHVQKRDVLVAHHHPDHASRILLWKESFRDDNIKPYINYDHAGWQPRKSTVCDAAPSPP